MDKKQADVVAQTILEPEVRAQEVARLRRAARAMERSRKQRIAWFTLAGFAAGAVVAYLAALPLLPGFVLGGLAGSLVGYVTTRRAAA